jgi:hypothetical protein
MIKLRVHRMDRATIRDTLPGHGVRRHDHVPWGWWAARDGVWEPMYVDLLSPPRRDRLRTDAARGVTEQWPYAAQPLRQRPPKEDEERSDRQQNWMIRK